jgi:Mce-associated membrane protein
MPPRKRTSSVLNGDANHDQEDTVESAAPDGALALELAEAEAEAAEAEAAVVAARARARAIKLRRQAEALKVAEPAELEQTDAVEFGELLPADEGDAPERRRVKLPKISLKAVAAALVVVATVALLAASAWMTVQHRQVAAEQQRSAEFAAAARQGVVTLMSLNFNSAADDVKRIIDSTTGDFKKDFESQAAEFTKAAQDSKVITEANVNAIAVKSMTQDTATVLIAVTTNVSNAASKQQQPRSWRLNVDVARDGGQIKLAKVEFVP